MYSWQVSLVPLLFVCVIDPYFLFEFLNFLLFLKYSTTLLVQDYTMHIYVYGKYMN